MLAAFACAIVSACGCSPQAALHVWPQAYCPGTPIHVAWEAKGDTYLKISPPDGDFTPVSNSGLLFLPPSQVTIDVEARRHNRRDAQQVTASPVASRPFVGEALDCDVQLAKTRAIQFRVGDYDERARLQSISSSCHTEDPSDPCPTITVCRGPNRADPCTGAGSQSWQIAPGQPVDLSHESVGMAGYWMLARKLTPGESCGPAAPGVAGAKPSTATQKMTHLKVQLNLSCSPQGGTS